MKREQDEAVLGPQSPLPSFDELLPSAFEGIWSHDNIFNFDASGTSTGRHAARQAAARTAMRVRDLACLVGPHLSAGA